MSNFRLDAKVHVLSSFNFYTQYNFFIYTITMPKIKPAKIVIIVLCVVAVVAAGWYFFKTKPAVQQYITAEVSRDSIEDSVLATGILEATKMVSVGAQVSGQVKKMYVQLGDQVKKVN